MAVDPTTVDTRAGFAAGLAELRADAGLSLHGVQRRAEEMPGAVLLPRSTVSDICTGTSTPSPETLATFLRACRVPEAAVPGWMAARERAITEAARQVPGAVRVRHALPRWLGVHAAIDVGDADDELPVYVPRDLDDELRPAIAAAAERGGFVLLQGDSSVGKTRALFEAVRAVLPEWWLVHPGDADAVRAFAGTPTARAVVWLDELQRYLDHPGGLPVAAVRALLAAKLVVVGTWWLEHYRTRSAQPLPGRPDLYANDRELLRLARLIDVGGCFSPAERRRAEARAGDRRIRAALDTRDAGLTQVLAAAPELIRCWEHAPAADCYGKAVITAALDARRVGAGAPLTREFLEAAAPAYLTSAQQAVAPPDWLDQGIGYATTVLRGAASALVPVAAGMGRIAGYTVADYLRQYALRARRTVVVPDAVWQALVDHHHRDDRQRLADNAGRRGHDRYEKALYEQATEDGSPVAEEWLEEEQAESCPTEELRELAAAGNWFAGRRLAEWLAENGRIDELRRLAGKDNWTATEYLVEWLVEAGDFDDALAVLREHSSDDGHREATSMLNEVLRQAGRIEELEKRADSGDSSARVPLAELLVKHRRLDRLRALANAYPDDSEITEILIDGLLRNGRFGELRRRTDAGEEDAREAWYYVLASKGDEDELRGRAERGCGSARRWIGWLHASRGRADEAILILRGCADADVRAMGLLTRLLAEQGRVEELRARADAGDYLAACHLVRLFAARRDVEALRAEVAAGTPDARECLAELSGGPGGRPGTGQRSGLYPAWHRL
ncbi:hypothetical protein DMB66_36680 [Actinoplanes sp. ATCC 53533]|uniref:helix-turn-helix domain-containing protein n=1 Tax=Actinoplanes sp. ATCC 53533 TaxID=1288362 RepID=UPI000F7A1BA2|nr:helix-turn-helix transcriptional regulator [Actinoplanes sp. ATCC 53533]RSM54895.1 hypothetical protein DMB66_36680 [Actinoplanes sp. ATCC 53533]